MNQGKLIIRKSSLFSWLLFILWFPPTSIIDTYSILFNLLKLSICSYVILEEVYRRKADSRYLVLWAYFAILLYSTYVQKNIKNLLLAMVYSLGVISMFYYLKGRELKSEIKKFFPITTAYLLTNVITVVFLENGITQNNLGQANYFIGGKFAVFYLSVIWLLQLMILRDNRLKKVKLVVVISALGLISYITDCSTAILCLTILFLIICFDKIKVFVFRPIAIIAVTAGLNVIFVFYYNFLQSGAFAYIVQNLLHRNLNLTGRTEIYERFFFLLGDSLILGEGYNNTLVSSTLGYLNSQNGFLDVISKVGIIGLLFFIAIIVLALYKSYNAEDMYYYREFVWPVLIIFLIAGLVEISFNVYFFFVLAMCFSPSNEQ